MNNQIAVVRLIRTFKSLNFAAKNVACAIRADRDLPLVVPAYTGDPGGEREAIIKSITELWHPDASKYQIGAGMMCVSAKTVEAVKQLNQAKNRFQNAVGDLRGQVDNSRPHIGVIAERILEQGGGRTETLKNIFTAARITEVDLLRCYTQTRILPKNMLSLSWSWATTHTTIYRTGIKKAVEMANALSSEDTRSWVISELGKLKPGEKLAYRKELPNRLVANLVWYEKEVPKRKSVSVSGVVLCQDARLPRYVWRDNPKFDNASSRQDRLSRLDTKIDPSPFIPALRLHRYFGAA